MDKIRIEGKELVKDQYSKAILSTDHNRLSVVRQMRQVKKNDHNKIEDLKEDIRSLKSDMEDLKVLLKTFINKQNI